LADIDVGVYAMTPRQIHALILEDQDDERLLLRSLLMFTEIFRADVTGREAPPEPLRLDPAQTRGIAIRKTLSYNSSNSA